MKPQPLITGSCCYKLMLARHYSIRGMTMAVFIVAVQLNGLTGLSKDMQHPSLQHRLHVPDGSHRCTLDSYPRSLLCCGLTVPPAEHQHLPILSYQEQ